MAACGKMIWLMEQTAAFSYEKAEQLLPLLTERRRERILRYRLERSRTEAILAELLLRFGYANEYGGALPEIVQTAQGKPQFQQGEVQFNLSHCRAAVACAISSAPVGVDVQPLASYRPALGRVLSADERALIEEKDSDARFTAIWTCKEAYGKALGCGIAYEMASMDFSKVRSSPTPVGAWLLWTLPRSGCFLSTCAKEPLELKTVTPEQLTEFAQLQACEN